MILFIRSNDLYLQKGKTAMDTTLKNLTGREITVYDVNGKGHIFYPEPTKAYIKINRVPIKELNGIRIVTTIKSEPFDMPGEQPGVFFIVSKMVGEALKKQGRTLDILVPDELMNAGQSKIIGCKSLSML